MTETQSAISSMHRPHGPINVNHLALAPGSTSAGPALPTGGEPAETTASEENTLERNPKGISDLFVTPAKAGVQAFDFTGFQLSPE